MQSAHPLEQFLMHGGSDRDRAADFVAVLRGQRGVRGPLAGVTARDNAFWLCRGLPRRLRFSVDPP